MLHCTMKNALAYTPVFRLRTFCRASSTSRFEDSSMASKSTPGSFVHSSRVLPARRVRGRRVPARCSGGCDRRNMLRMGEPHACSDVFITVGHGMRTGLQASESPTRRTRGPNDVRWSRGLQALEAADEHQAHPAVLLHLVAKVPAPGSMVDETGEKNDAIRLMYQRVRNTSYMPGMTLFCGWPLEPG